MSRHSSAMVVLTLVLVGYGCSRDPGFVVVRGTVTYQGEPIEDGDIKFVPAQGTQTPVRSTMIKQGKYATPARGALLPGTYRIEIRSYIGGSGDGPQIDPYDRYVDPNSTAPKPKPREQILPEEYNRNSKLPTLTVTEGSASITRDFELK